MCIQCYMEVGNGLQSTKPRCANPGDASMSRASGWLCSGCGHWHPYPGPNTPVYRIDYPREGVVFCRTCQVAFVYVPEQGPETVIAMHETNNPYRHKG